MGSIILIGMPGSGKSTLGKALAEKLGRAFFDADKTLEERENRSIKDFFAESENAFREAETRTLRFLSEAENAVIATGGGAVKRAENMDMLRKNGVIIFIDRGPEKILASLTDDSRPLLAEDKQKIFKLYEERIALYRKYADRAVSNNGTKADALRRLLEIAKERAE